MRVSQGLLSTEPDDEAFRAPKKGSKILRTLNESSLGLMDVVHPRMQREAVRWIAESHLESMVSHCRIKHDIDAKCRSFTPIVLVRQ